MYRVFLLLALVLAGVTLYDTMASSTLRAQSVRIDEPTPRPSPTPTTPDPIEHIVILVKENPTFDNYFGTFPGADGTTVGRLSNGRVVPLSHTPDHTLLDIAHHGDAAAVAVANGKMDGFDLLPGAIQNG